MSKDNKIPFLSLVLIASLLVMSIATYGPVFASNGNGNGNGNGEENGNGNGNGECECPDDVVVVVNGTDEDGGNQTEDIPDGDVIVIDEPQGNQTTGNQTTGNQTTGNQTGPVITEPEQEPQTKPSAINLAVIDAIQRGHTQHVTAYVTDDQGNEFTNETVTVEVVNAKDKLLREFEAGSGQDVEFKVGPNTSPQTLEVKATLESNPDVMATADYYVFPRGQAPAEPVEPPVNQTEPTPEPTPFPEPFPSQNETMPVPTVNQTNTTLPNATFG